MALRLRARWVRIPDINTSKIIRHIRSTAHRIAIRVRDGRLRIPVLSSALSGLLVLCGLLVVWIVASYPPMHRFYPLEATLSPRAKRQLILLDHNGKRFARRGGCIDAPVNLDEIPQHFVDAVLSMEDRRFYYHFGIDPWGILRAALNNYQAGKVVEGGSTITQQLAKLSYLSSERTMQRKMKEAVIVLGLEMMLSKKQILERYLNAAYFGEGCHGLRAATRHYFSKDVATLTISESALLVALLRAPSRLSRRHDEAWARHRLVLRAMVDNGRLDAKDVAGIEIAKIKKREDVNQGAYYADWIAQTANAPQRPITMPLKVHTSYIPKLQRVAEQAVESVLKASSKGRRVGQAALVAMRPDGRVVAIVGGRDYDKSQFNRAVQALRQPGSAFKTIVYLAALREGAHASMMVEDEPIAVGDWIPKNYGLSHRGLVSLQQAFASSINTVAVRVSEATGRNNVIGTARDLGISTPLTPTPSIALGASEVSLLELTAAYAAIAANAYPVIPWGVAGLGDAQIDGGKPPKGAGEWRLLVGQEMRDLLAITVQHGTARAAQLPIRAYGKTGTSQDFRDAWFIGFAGNLVVGVWVGNDNNKPMRSVTGGSLPAQIWRQFMTQARRADPNYKSSLPRIAAFKAKWRPTTDRDDAAYAFEDALYASQTVTIVYDPNYSGWPRISLFGYRSYPNWSQSNPRYRRPTRHRRPRTRPPWWRR